MSGVLNLNTHCSERLVRYVAQLEGIDDIVLGQKGKSAMPLGFSDPGLLW